MRAYVTVVDSPEVNDSQHRSRRTVSRSIKELIRIYEAWDKDDQAAEWRAKLDEWQATTQPAAGD